MNTENENLIPDFPIKKDYNTYIPLMEHFKTAMKRSGRLIYNYWDNSEYRCLFWNNKDTNQTDNNITIFYPIEAPIKSGMFLKYRNKTFLTLNQETVENDVYYKSDLIEANTKLEIFKNGKLITTPAYSYGITNTNPQNAGNQIILVNGEIDIITEYNANNKVIEINDTFQGMGGTYQIVNKYFNDNGILRLSVKRVQNDSRDYYEVVINNTQTDYIIGDSFTLDIIARRIEDGKEVLVEENPKLSFSSSDSAIATVNNGVVLCSGLGSAAIVVNWDDKDVSVSFIISISEAEEELPPEVPPRMEVYAVDGRNEHIILNQNKEFHVSVWDKYGREIIPPDFDTYDEGIWDAYFTEISRNGNIITLKISGTTHLNKTRELEFYNTKYNLTKLFMLKVVSSYPN